MRGDRFERRMGQRVPVEPQPVRWRIQVDAAGGARRRRLRRSPEVAELLDVSVSGLRVRAPAGQDLMVGSVFSIEVDGHVGRVRIRRISPGPDAGRHEYGLELAEAHSPLTEHLHRQLTRMSEARLARALRAGIDP